MGLFKKIREVRQVVGQVPEMLDQAGQMQVQGQAMQAEYAKIQRGEVDDALLVPIEGVDLQTYARIVKTQAEGGLTTDEFNAWLLTQGITEKQHAVASAGWLSRIRENMTLGGRYGAIYRHTSLD